MIVKIILSILGIIISSTAGYIFGRRKKIDEIRLNIAFPKAEEISIIIQEIFDDEESLTKWWHNNFGHLKNIDEGIEYFEKHNNLYENEHQVVQNLLNKSGLLCKNVRSARIYLNEKDLDRIEEYLSIGHFTYSSDGLGGILFSTFLKEFFSNLLDEENSKKRIALFAEIKKRLNKMHNI